MTCSRARVIATKSRLRSSRIRSGATRSAEASSSTPSKDPRGCTFGHRPSSSPVIHTRFHSSPLARCTVMIWTMDSRSTRAWEDSVIDSDAMA